MHMKEQSQDAMESHQRLQGLLRPSLESGPGDSQPRKDSQPCPYFNGTWIYPRVGPRPCKEFLWAWAIGLQDASNPIPWIRPTRADKKASNCQDEGTVMKTETMEVAEQY